jgi:hypothetical protein
MLYLIGGAARAGKTILARRICRGGRVTHFSIDKLIAGLAATAPELGLKIRDPARKRAEILWPVLRLIAGQASRAGEDFLLEGDALLPGRVAEFISSRSLAAKACFIGYAHANPKAKLRAIRRYAADRNDWTHKLDDAALLKLIGELRDFSESLRGECRLHGVPYFDASDRFASRLHDAEAYFQLPPGSAKRPALRCAQSSLRLP